MPVETVKLDDLKIPDELVLDNLYLDLHGLADGALSVRVGRQDFM